MLDKLFRKAAKQKKDEVKAQKAEAAGEQDSEEALDETGTFMLDVSQLQDSEDLEDLLKDL